MQLICSICEEVLKKPVTTPCGHNFCMDCIRVYWKNNVLCQCPQCKEKFPNISELQVNTQLSKMVDEFWNPFVVNNTSPQDQCLDHPREVSRDICVGREVKAVNSSFEASYCETPLEPNQRVTTLRRQQHVENPEEHMCERHGRCLEFKTDYNTHNTLPLEVETRKNNVQLGKAEVQQMIQGRQQKVIEIRNSLQSSGINAEQEVENSCQIFRALMRSIERSQAELIEVISEKQKETKRLAEGLIKELEQEITDLKLLQSSPSLCTSPPTKDWSEIRVQTFENVGMVRKAVKRAGSQFEDALKSELKRLCEAELKVIQQWSVDVTLDPDTAHPNLTLSEDVKQLRHPGRRQNYPSNPERFFYIASILGKEGYSSGRFYYGVQVKGNTLWSLGVARESIKRTIYAATPENGLWTIQQGKGNIYRACTTDPTPLSLSEKPQTVGVYVDYEDGEVSFYNAQAKSHIYSFTDCSFTEKLYPYFNLGVCGIDKMSAPLIISHMGVELQRQSLSPVLCAVVWTILSCGILLAFCFLLFTLRFKNNRIVKMSSPNLNVLTLCGSVLTYSSGFLFAFEERTHLQGGGVRAILQARIWMFCIGSTLVFGPILGKTWRLYRVFTQRVPDKRVIIRDIQLMGLVALLILLDLLVLTAWSLTDPVKCARSIGAMVKVVERELSYSLSQLDSCSSLYSDLWVILLAMMKGGLLLYGTYLAGLTSNVSLPPVNQSPTIMTAVSLVTLSTVVAVPVSQFLQAWPNVVYSVVAGAIFICTLATNCMLFVPQLTQWRRFEEEQNSLSQMAKYFSSPSKSVHSVYSQDEVYYLLGENNSMKRLLNEKNAVIDSLQEQVNNAKDKLLRLMSNTHSHEDQEMDSSTTNLHSSSTQTTVVPSDCFPTPLPQRDVAETTLSSPPFSLPPLSSPPPPALSFPPGDCVSVKPCSVEFGPYIQGSEMETEAGGCKVEGTVSQQQCGAERSHLPVSPQPSVSSKTGVRTPGEMGGTQTTPSCQSNYVTSSSTLPLVGLAPAQSEPSGCHGDTTSPWMAGVRQAGFVSSVQLQEILQELSVDTVMETALRSPNHSRGFRRPSQPSSTNPSVLSPLSFCTPHSPNHPLLFHYPSISPYVMRKRRPPFHSPRGGPPPCYYPGSKPPGWGRRRDTGLSQPDKHPSKTQPLLNPVATETNLLRPDDSDGEEGVEAWHRIRNSCGRRGSRWEHRPPPLRKCPPDVDGGGEGGPDRDHGRDSYGYWDSDSSSLADYSYYHRPYCDACLQHGSYPSSDSSSSDSSDSEYGGFTSLCRSTHPVVNFKEDLKPTFV